MRYVRWKKEKGTYKKKKSMVGGGRGKEEGCKQ